MHANKKGEESYREKQGRHIIGGEGRIRDEAVGEIMDGVLEGEVDERLLKTNKTEYEHNENFLCMKWARDAYNRLRERNERGIPKRVS